MTILFFSRLFYPHIGGVETHVLKISQQLIQKGHTIHVITEQFDTTLSVVETYKGIEIHRIPIVSKKNKKHIIWKWLWEHKKLLDKAEIIHAHDVGFWFLPFRILYPFKKFFITFHGYETHFPPLKKAILIRKISEVISNGSIVVGEYIKKWYYASPDIVMYGGVDKLKVKSEKLKVETEKLKVETDKLKVNRSKINIVFVGRIEDDNGVFIYKKVLEQFNKNKIPFNFTAVGSGSKKAIFEQFGAILGFIENVDENIAQADIVFASSYLSILQALTQRKIVVAVYDNELKEDYLKNTPFSKGIIISNSPEEIISLIEKSPKELDTSVVKFLEENTWEKITEKYIKLWEK